MWCLSQHGVVNGQSSSDVLELDDAAPKCYQGIRRREVLYSVGVVEDLLRDGHDVLERSSRLRERDEELSIDTLLVDEVMRLLHVMMLPKNATDRLACSHPTENLKGLVLVSRHEQIVELHDGLGDLQHFIVLPLDRLSSSLVFLRDPNAFHTGSGTRSAWPLAAAFGLSYATSLARRRGLLAFAAAKGVKEDVAGHRICSIPHVLLFGLGFGVRYVVLRPVGNDMSMLRA